MHSKHGKAEILGLSKRKGSVHLLLGVSKERRMKRGTKLGPKARLTREQKEPANSPLVLLNTAYIVLLNKNSFRKCRERITTSEMLHNIGLP